MQSQSFFIHVDALIKRPCQLGQPLHARTIPSVIGLHRRQIPRRPLSQRTCRTATISQYTYLRCVRSRA